MPRACRVLTLGASTAMVPVRYRLVESGGVEWTRPAGTGRTCRALLRHVRDSVVVDQKCRRTGDVRGHVGPQAHVAGALESRGRVGAGDQLPGAWIRAGEVKQPEPEHSRAAGHLSPDAVGMTGRRGHTGDLDLRD